MGADKKWIDKEGDLTLSPNGSFFAKGALARQDDAFWKRH